MLAWLLNERSAKEIREALIAAENVATSDLTLIECDRVMRRAVALRAMTESAAAERQAVLSSVARGWSRLHMIAEVVDRARAGFPVEPVRSLDAIHLASAAAWARVGSVTVLSLDDRIRRNARALGLDVAPASVPI